MPYVLIGLCAVVVLGLLVLAGLYNSLVGTRNAADSAFSTIDVMLKKRTDLIPNLVASVQQYMKHESGLLTKITELRAAATSAPPQSAQRLEAEGQLTGALGQLRVSMEAYPDLKANQNVLQLQGSLNECEEQISAARRAFNAAVLALNNAIDMFPTNILAGMMSLQRRTFFEIPETERKAPDVKAMFS